MHTASSFGYIHNMQYTTPDYNLKVYGSWYGGVSWRDSETTTQPLRNIMRACLLSF